MKISTHTILILLACMFGSSSMKAQEGEQLFKDYVVVELAILVRKNPTMSMSELLQDATEVALEEWDRDLNQD